MARDRTSRDAFGRPLADSGPQGRTSTDPHRDLAPTGPAALPRDAPSAAIERRRASVDRGPGGGSPTVGSPATNPQATIALVLGVLSFCVLPLILSVAAIVVGNRAIAAASALPGAPGLRAARAGRILGWASLAFWVLFPLLLVVLFVASAATSP